MAGNDARRPGERRFRADRFAREFLDWDMTPIPCQLNRPPDYFRCEATGGRALPVGR
jgi:hypothetical protein